MLVYIASRFEDYEQASRVVDLLRAAGHESTSSWLDVARKLEGRHGAIQLGALRRTYQGLQDLEDVRRASAFVLILPPDKNGGAGCYCELGSALTLSKRCLVIGALRYSPIFLELCELYVTPEAAIEALSVEPDHG